MLKGLHFDVLLGMSWIKETNTEVNTAEGAVNVDGEKLKFKPYIEPALFIVEEGERVYSWEKLRYCPGNCGCASPPQYVTRNEVHFVK